MRKYFCTILLLCSVLVFVPLHDVQAQSGEDVPPAVAGDLQRQMQALQSQIDALMKPSQNAPAQEPRQIINLQQKLFNLGRYLVDADKQLAQLEALCRDYKNHCLFISEFWRVRALKSCVDFNRYVLEDMASLSGELTQQQQAFYGSSIEQCTLSYYYDNWDDVRATIAKTTAKAKAQKDAGTDATQQ